MASFTTKRKNKEFLSKIIGQRTCDQDRNYQEPVGEGEAIDYPYPGIDEEGDPGNPETRKSFSFPMFQMSALGKVKNEYADQNYENRGVENCCNHWLPNIPTRLGGCQSYRYEGSIRSREETRLFQPLRSCYYSFP